MSGVLRASRRPARRQRALRQWKAMIPVLTAHDEFYGLIPDRRRHEVRPGMRGARRAVRLGPAGKPARRRSRGTPTAATPTLRRPRDRAPVRPQTIPGSAPVGERTDPSTALTSTPAPVPGRLLGPRPSYGPGARRRRRWPCDLPAHRQRLARATGTTCCRTVPASGYRTTPTVPFLQKLSADPAAVPIMRAFGARARRPGPGAPRSRGRGLSFAVTGTLNLSTGRSCSSPSGRGPA